MASRGQTENKALRANMEDQLDRLMQQLQDLDECKDDLEADEYEEMKRDTLEQLKEFQTALNKMQEGDLSLVDSCNAMQLAIRAAITEAFQTPDVIKFFAKKQPGQLRTRLAQVERDVKIGHLSREAGDAQKAEILAALLKLGENLSSSERSFLEEKASAATREFAEATGDSVELSSSSLQTIGSQVQAQAK